MNISHKDLADLYRSYLGSRIPASRKGCPESGEIWRLFDRRIGERAKSKLLGHIGQCSYCSEDFLALLEIRRATRRLEAEIDSFGIRGDRATPRRTSGGWKRWQFAFLMAGSFILAAALFVFLRTGPFRARPSDEARAHARPPIELLQPVRGALVPRNELRFLWRKSEQIDAYVLELFDVSLARLWKSDVVEKPEIVPPPGVLASLRRAGSYFWMISGYDPGGRAIESDLRGFRITD
jgi:hypothetical protein